MADTKISALTAASAAAAANEFAINEAGTSKKVTVQQVLDAVNVLADAAALAGTDKLLVIQSGVAKDVTAALMRTYVGPKLVASGAAPAAGAANGEAAPSETLLLNTADNAVTTIETVMSCTGLVAGTYLYEYYVVWRSGTTTVGCSFAVDYTGTVTRTRQTRHYQSTGTSAATGVSDGTSVVLTGTLVEHMSAVADAGELGPNTGVGATTEDQFDHIRGILVVSTGGNLDLKMTGEGGGAVTFMADSMLRLTRLA